MGTGLFTLSHADSSAAATAPDLNSHRERERIAAQARAHRPVAIQLGELVRENAAKREDLHQQLMRREDGNDLSSAWLRSRIEEVDRLITQQEPTAGWHLRESCRLRQRIQGGGYRSADPAARGRGRRSRFRAGNAS